VHYLPKWKPLYRKVMTYGSRRRDTPQARVIVVVAAGTKSVKCYGSTAVSNTASPGSTPGTLAVHPRTVPVIRKYRSNGWGFALTNLFYVY